MNVKPFFAAAMAAAVVLLPLPTNAQQVTQGLTSESVIETIKERGVVKIGLSLFIPWSMRDKNGELIGYELDVGNKLAQDMGVEAEFIPTPWDGIIPALVGGQLDFIISGMSITTKRNLTVNFTEPYDNTGLVIVVNKELTKDMTVADFNSSDFTFATRRGSLPATVIENEFPDAEILLFDDDGADLQEVLNGNAHAYMASEPTPSRDTRRYPDILGIPSDKLYGARGAGIALRKGDVDALNLLNNWIAQQWRSGWLEDRQDYWFRSTDWEHLVSQ